jgi:predicted transcriptional regulator
MPQIQTQLADQLGKLTYDSFEAFCEDIAGMFDCSIKVVERQTLYGSLNTLKKEFKKITVINTVEAKGALHGDFALWLDQAATFVLSGIVVMLPENRIQEQVKKGALSDAQNLGDAVRELGNLMVGSWDRAFRESLNGHKHFKQVAVFIGQPWNNPEESLKMKPEDDCLIVLNKIKYGTFDPFLCAAVYPQSLLDPKPIEAEQSQPDEKTVAPVVLTEKVSANEKPSEPLPSAESVQPQPDKKTVAPVVSTEKVSANEKPSEPLPSARVETIEQPVKSNPVSQAIEQLVGSVETTSSLFASQPPQFSSAILNMPAQDLMDPQPVWGDPEDSIQNAILLMQQHHTGYLLMGKGGQLEGILSLSNVAAAVSPYTRKAFARHRRPQDDATFQIRAKWFMSCPVHTIAIDTPVWAVMDAMCRHAVRSLVVLDQHQKTTGLITAFDIFKKLIATETSTLPAGRICQIPPF